MGSFLIGAFLVALRMREREGERPEKEREIGREREREPRRGRAEVGGVMGGLTIRQENPLL